MTRDEARERFADAHDGTLGAAERAELDAILASDSELAKEYADYRATISNVGALLGADDSVDLLPDIQRKIRARSRGRFYRDRWSTSSSRSTTVTLVAVVVVFGALLLAWLLMSRELSRF